MTSLPSRLPDLPQDGAAFTNRQLQFPQGESVSACGQTLTVREVGEDWRVVCACGWWGIPTVARPDVLRCEACDTMAEGRLRNAMWIAVNTTLEGQR